MVDKKLKALLIGWSSGGCSSLSWRLKKQECDCLSAICYQEVCWLLHNRCFDLVLSPIIFNCNCLFPLVAQLDGSGTTLFFSQAMEDGCWWLPALRLGANCVGSAALRHSESIPALDQTIREIRSNMRMAAEPQPAMASHFSSSSLPLPLSQRISLSATRVTARSSGVVAFKNLG
jgi:hypothetical protein